MSQQTARYVPPTLPSESPNSRRPPQSNCPPGNVRLPDHGKPLEPKSRKGGISLSTPPTLARQLQSLPPMLHMRDPSPMPRCSKAPRGLFVQVCVTRVFTGISVSPGPSLRQRPSRYAFRAGRNFDVHANSFESLRLCVHLHRDDLIATVSLGSARIERARQLSDLRESVMGKVAATVHE